MPNLSKGSKAYKRRSVKGEKRIMDVRTTARQETRDKAVYNDQIETSRPKRAGTGGPRLGPNLLVNPEFIGSTGWTLGSGWLVDIASFPRQAIHIFPSGADSDLEQTADITLETGTYEFGFRLGNLDDANLEVWLDGSKIGEAVPTTDDGKFLRFTGTATGPTAALFIRIKTGGSGAFKSGLYLKRVLGA